MGVSWHSRSLARCCCCYLNVALLLFATLPSTCMYNIAWRSRWLTRGPLRSKQQMNRAVGNEAVPQRLRVRLRQPPAIRLPMFTSRRPGCRPSLCRRKLPSMYHLRRLLPRIKRRRPSLRSSRPYPPLGIIRQTSLMKKATNTSPRNSMTLVKRRLMPWATLKEAESTSVARSAFLCVGISFSCLRPNAQGCWAIATRISCSTRTGRCTRSSRVRSRRMISFSRTSCPTRIVRARLLS